MGSELFLRSLESRDQVFVLGKSLLKIFIKIGEDDDILDLWLDILGFPDSIL